MPDHAEELGVFIGEWSLEPDAPWAPGGDVGARVTWEWMEGGPYLIQRWQVPIDVAPDGLAVIGWDEGRGTYLQHYFDTRGVARVYEMGLEGGVWTLERTKPDFSELAFWQRFEGRFSDDGRTIAGRFDISHDEGATWELDFHMNYRRTN